MISQVSGFFSFFAAMAVDFILSGIHAQEQKMGPTGVQRWFVTLAVVTPSLPDVQLGLWSEVSEQSRAGWGTL